MAGSNDQLETLYQRFRNELSTDPDTMFYEEDELLDVFDYAGDIADNYVRVSALFLGRRLYPESDALRVRMGLLLDTFNVSSLEDFLNDNTSRHGVLWEMLRLRNSRLSSDEIETSLDRLIEEYTFNDDEDIIQLVNLIEVLEKEDWLIANIEKVKARCKYPDTLMYEAARLLNYSHRDISLNLFEQLTDIDPFNYDNWAQLAETYAEVGKMDDAVNALEYAKAIKPDDVELMFLEASLLLDRRENIERAITLLQKVITMVPAHFAAKRNLAVAFILQGKPDMAEMMWEQELANDPCDLLALQEMIELDTQAARPHVERYYSLAGEKESETTLVQRVENWAIMGAHDKALLFLDTYNKKYGIREAAAIYLRELYLEGRIKDVWDFFSAQQQQQQQVTYDLPSIAIIAATMLRLGMYEDVVTFCTHYIEHTYQINGSPENMLMVTGLRRRLSDIRHLAHHPEYIPSPDFDPLGLTDSI